MTANPGGGDYIPTYRQQHAAAIADALEAAVHMVDDDESAETLARMADGWREEIPDDRLRESIGRLDARPSGMWPSNAIDRATGRPPTVYTPPEDVVYPARETGTDGMTNLEGELAQLRAEVEAAREAADRRLDKSVEWMERAEAAGVELAEALAQVARVDKLREELAAVDGSISPEAKAWTHWAAHRIGAALDGPVTSATSPSPASTGDTGTPAGSAPSDSPSEAQSDGSAS